MRTKRVYETLNFKRGEDPHKALNIGLYERIENWLKNDLIVSDFIDKRSYKLHDDLSIDIFDYAGVSYETDWIPDNIHFHKGFDITECYNITELPKNMVVDEALDLTDCSITTLPMDIKVKVLYCDKVLFENLVDEDRIESYMYSDSNMYKKYYKVKLKYIN